LGWNSYNNDNHGFLVSNNPGASDSDSTTQPCWVYGDMGAFGSNGANPEDQLNTTNIQKGLLFPYVGNVMVYQCPGELRIVKVGNQSGPIVRNYSMSGQMNGQDNLSNYSKTNNVKESDILHPVPSRAMVFIHESEYTIDDGYFAIDVVTRDWQNYPAVLHMKGDNLSFADGHCEHWTFVMPSTMTMTSPGGNVAAKPNDRDFDRMAGAYSTPLSGAGQW
jgi:hypothetical protein